MQGKGAVGSVLREWAATAGSHEKGQLNQDLLEKQDYLKITYVLRGCQS